MIVPGVKYGLVLWGLCGNLDLFKSIERLHCRAAHIIYNLPKDMALEDVLRHVQWLTFFMYYKLDILRLFYRVHSESLPDIMYENIGRNQVYLVLTSLENRTFW